jgi:molybdenum cofactor synthesis domain-containing protein
MKLMRTEDAIGQVLCHDITQIIPGVKKGPVFKKGHIITPEDVPVLLSVGKEHVYIWEKDDTRFHENEAARILCEMSRNAYMNASEPSEGKIELTAQVDGLFTLDRQRLYAVNSLGEMMIATRHAGPVKKGDKLAGMRVIPLVIEKEKMAEARKTAGNTPLLTLTPYRALKVGLVTTGSEVYYGRIQDQFTPVIKAKLAEYGAEVTHHVLLPDDHAAVTEKIKEFLADGVDMVLCTGGMSVDPDDKTPLAIKNAGVNVVTYGAPVLPGAMFLLSYTDDGRPVCGLPGCVMYAKRTIFDLVLPYLAAGVPVTKEQIAAYGEGGLCLNCKVCTWPNCGFGKGV